MGNCYRDMSTSTAANFGNKSKQGFEMNPNDSKLNIAKGKQNFSINDTNVVEDPVEKKDPDASKKVEVDPALKECVDYNSKDVYSTHFTVGDTDLNYATESNIHYLQKKPDSKGQKKIDARAMLTNQFDFGDPKETKKENFYKTTYN